MKWLRILYLTFLLFFACQSPKPDISTIEVSVLYDLTDDMVLKPEYSLLRRMYDFNEHPDREAVFHATAITDKKLNPVYTARLANDEYTEAHNETDDVSYRRRCIQAFDKRVETIITTIKDSASKTAKLDHSECMSGIAQALSQLSTSKAGKKTLLIFSDLAENGALNVYDAYKTWQLKDTVAISKDLLRAVSLPANLSGIQVYFLYRPKSREDDQQYSVLSSVYRSLLMQRGATVIISASNDINLP